MFCAREKVAEKPDKIFLKIKKREQKNAFCFRNFYLFIEHILQPVAERFLPGTLPFRQRILELAQLRLLFAGQTLRHFHHDRYILVAASAGVEPLNALAAQTEHRARLGALRHRIRDRTVNRRNCQLIAVDRLIEADRDLTPDIVPFSAEGRIGGDADRHQKIARRPAVDTGIASSAQGKGLSIVDTRRNIDLDGRGRAGRSASAAFRTALENNLASAAAGVAGALRRHHSERRALLNASFVNDNKSDANCSAVYVGSFVTTDLNINWKEVKKEVKH